MFCDLGVSAIKTTNCRQLFSLGWYKNMKIPFARPMLSDIEKSAVSDVLNGTVLTHGPNCANFEKILPITLVQRML